MTNGTHPDEPTEDVITWRHSATGQTYALTTDSYRCLVWRTMRDTWGAVVNSDGSSLAKYDCPTPEDAKTWCEARVRGYVDPLPSTEVETAASESTADPRWRYRTQDRSYTLGYGSARCRIWHTIGGTWCAVVGNAGRVKRTYTFDTLEEAQAWGEAQISKA